MSKHANTRRAASRQSCQRDGHNNGMRPLFGPDAYIQSTTEQRERALAEAVAEEAKLDLRRVEAALRAGYAPERIIAAAEQYREAVAWVATNPDAWGYIVGRARADASSEHRVSLYAYFEAARSGGLLDAHDRPATFDNTARPVLARLLVAEVPEAEQLIELRASVFDHIAGGGAHEQA